MRILSFNWHTPYLSLLAGLPHQFEIAPPNIPNVTRPSWDETMRPLTPNVAPVTSERAFARLREGAYDLVIAHNVKDIAATADVPVPKILVFHNKLSTEAALGKQGRDVVESYRAQVEALTASVHRIFISESKKNDWRLDGAIITPGIDAAQYGGYTGHIRRALCVGNSVKVRDLMTGYSVQRKVLDGLPNILAGENPDIPESRVSQGWAGLKQAYRENRLLLNTGMPPWEDGYNFAVLEAMATGMPVVSIANPTSPLTGGVDGLIGESDDELRERVISLLDDPKLARRLGAEGRKTVERKFSISAFLEKWENAIRQTVEAGSGAPAIRKRAPKRFPKMRSGRKNVILSYTSYPATAAAYLEKALRGGHDVLTAGCKITPEVVKAWDLGGLEGKIKTHDIQAPDLTADIGYILERTPKDFAPDFFLWVETGLGKAPVGLDMLSCPTACYLIDTHIHLDRHIETASMFDMVFLAQRDYIPEFNKRGMLNVHWLPLACDPETHGKADVAKEFDVGFVGSMSNGRRAELLMKLAERVEVRYGRLFLRDMAEFFCKSRLVFNNAIRNDLNMRVFEALCSGTALLTDRAGGLDEFFEDRKHLIVYDDGNIADLARHYIGNPDEREKIAGAGRKLVLEKHTYAHRAADIVRVMEALAG